MAVDMVQTESSVEAGGASISDNSCTGMAVTDGTKVSVGVGVTKNMGNYESARLEVRIEIPCMKSEEDAAFELARSWCDSKMEVMLQNLGGSS